MKCLYSIFVCLLIVSGCSASRDSGVEIEQLKSAPSETILEGVTYSLEAYIWRDLMPSTDSSLSRGVMAVVKIKTADSSKIPVLLKVSKLWFLNKNDIWETKPVRTDFLTPNVLEVFVSRGPKWDKGTKIDIAAEIEINNHAKLLGLKNQVVQAVY